MTAAALTPSKEYIENGVTLAYAVPFRFRAATHIKAQRISAAGVVTELAYGTDYSVTGGETDAGGTLTVTVAGAAGTRLRIRRETPRSQDMDYTTGDTFPAESHEGALDKAMLIDQEQDQKVDDLSGRALLVRDGERGYEFPALSSRAGKTRLLGHASDGAIAMLDLGQLAKGDPGGNAMAVGLFVAIPGLLIPVGTDQIRTNGYAEKGSGAAHYVFDAAVDAAYVAANPRIAVLSSNGRGFRLNEDMPNIRQTGARGDNATDDTAAIAAAYTFIAARGGGVIDVPAGNYVASFIEPRANTILRGVGRASQIRQKPGTLPRYPEGDALIAVNLIDANSSADPASNMRNVAICDLRLVGNCVSEGFYETMALVGAQAVTGLHVYGNEIVGFQGDGVCIYSGTSAAAERHSLDIFIKNNYFDGQNYENRNAISIYDGDNVLIEGNSITRCTKSTMPGAIDIEGRAFDYAIYRNITIRKNRIFDIGVAGSKPFIVVYPWKLVNAIGPNQNIIIEENSFENGKMIEISCPETATPSTASLGVMIQKNGFKNINGPCSLYAFNGAAFCYNMVEDWDDGFEIGFGVQTYDLRFENNRFRNCASANAAGVLFDVRVLDGLVLKNNTYVNCGRADGSAGTIVRVVPGAFLAKNFDIDDEIVVATNSRTKAYILGSASLDMKSTRVGNIRISNSGSGAAVISASGSYFGGLSDSALFPFDCYSLANVPNDFPVGRTDFQVFAGAAHPSGGNNGLVQTVVAMRIAGGLDAAFQTYRAIDGTFIDSFWERRATASGTAWTAWKKFTGV